MVMIDRYCWFEDGSIVMIADMNNFQQLKFKKQKLERTNLLKRPSCGKTSKTHTL